MPRNQNLKYPLPVLRYSVHTVASLKNLPKEKPPSSDGGPFIVGLMMSYFHTGIRTIIGAEAFHGPVRDGKEWDHLAMIIRLEKVRARIASQPIRRVDR